MTEDQFYKTSPRTFTNILKGRKRLQEEKNSLLKLEDIKHRELIYSLLAPHMKKTDRDKAYDELQKQAAGDNNKKPALEKAEGLTPQEVKKFLAKEQERLNKKSHG